MLYAQACVDAGGDACVANLVAAEAVEEAAREEKEGGGKEHSGKSNGGSEGKSKADAKKESSEGKELEPENVGNGARTRKRFDPPIGSTSSCPSRLSMDRHRN